MLQKLSGQVTTSKSASSALNEGQQSNYEPCDNEGTGDEIEKICAWLESDYKMTETELKEAEEILDNYFKKGTTQYELKNCSNGSGRFYVLRAEMSEAELEEYQLMCALENKCSPIASFTCGVLNGIPFFGMGMDYIEKWYLADNRYAEKISFGTAVENSRTQHLAATKGGEIFTFIMTSGLGIFELDFPMDVRDLLADIYLWDKDEQSGWWLLLDIIAFIPMIGALKYGDDVVALVKKVEWKKYGGTSQIRASMIGEG